MRKRRAEKRYIKPDPKFSDVTVSKFINVLMNDGKKSAARKIIYGAFDIIEGKTKIVITYEKKKSRKKIYKTRSQIQ